MINRGLLVSLGKFVAAAALAAVGTFFTKNPEYLGPYTAFVVLAVHDVTDFLGLEEWTYIVVFVWLAVAGPGAISIDRLLARYFKLDDKPAAQLA